MTKIQRSLNLIMQAALDAAMPKDKFKFIPESPKGNLIVLGAGKAAASMAAEFEKNYDKPLEGMVITRYEHHTDTKFIKVVEASHPNPDESGLLASKKLFDLAAK